LQYLPSDEEISSMQDWLSKAFEYAKRLPVSMDDLVKAIETNKLVDHELSAYFGHPVKVRGLIYWLRRTQAANVGARALQMLSDRAGQYDVKAMLAPP
jgi:hypothetical protein